MIKNYKLQIINIEKGITIVEIAVVIFIVALLSVILISDFPKIQRQMALSRVTYKLAQDLRKTQDFGLSGVQVNDAAGNPVKAKGYGIYIDLISSTKKYVMYADVADISGNSDQKYSNGSSYPLCSGQTNPTSDCAVEVIDISQQNPNLYIKQISINGSTSNSTSINFSPPNPTVNIENLSSGNSVGIILGLSADSSAIRTVWVNKAGLINVQ